MYCGDTGCLPVEHPAINPKKKAGASSRPLYDVDAAAVKALLERVEHALVENSLEECSLQDGGSSEDNMVSAPAAAVSPDPKSPGALPRRGRQRG